MKLRELESNLQDLDGFAAPKIAFEQYATSAHIASHMLYTIDQTFDEIQGMIFLSCLCMRAISLC